MIHNYWYQSIIWINCEWKDISLAIINNFTISCQVCVFNFPGKRRGCSCSKIAYHYNKHLWKNIMPWHRDFTESAITTNSFHHQCSTNASMTSASDNEQHPRHISISEETQNGQVLCPMIWLFVSTDVQIVSDISNTTISKASFSLRFEVRQTRDMTLDLSLHFVMSLLFALITNSRSPQSQCVFKSQVVRARLLTTY